MNLQLIQIFYLFSFSLKIYAKRVHAHYVLNSNNENNIERKKATEFCRVRRSKQ